MANTVLVTGASRGIGRAIAIAFAEAGYCVAVHYHTAKEAADSVRQELLSRGVSAITVQADIAEKQQVDTMLKHVYQAFGSIDVLVNNAGIAQQKLFSDIRLADWQRMFAVNVDGMFYCCQGVLPDMIHRKKGKIINISSMWGQVGASCEVHYSASKAAVIGMTKALAKELGPSNIQVNCIAPGLIDTDMNRHLSETDLKDLCEEIPMGVIGKAQDIASCAVFLASSQADYITGQVLGINGGMIC